MTFSRDFGFISTVHLHLHEKSWLGEKKMVQTRNGSHSTPLDWRRSRSDALRHSISSHSKPAKMRKLAHGRSLGPVPAPKSSLGPVPPPKSSLTANAPASGRSKEESAQFKRSRENGKQEQYIDDVFENLLTEICAEVFAEVVAEKGASDLAEVDAEKCMEVSTETLAEAKNSHSATVWVFPWLPMDLPSGRSCYWKSGNVFENKPSYSLLPALSSGETVVADEKKGLVTNEATGQSFEVESRYWNLMNEEISEEPPEMDRKRLKEQLFLWVETPRTEKLMKTNSCVVAPYGLRAKDILECLRVGFDDMKGIQKPTFEVLEISDKDGRRMPLRPDVVLNEAFVDAWGRDVYARASR